MTKSTQTTKKSSVTPPQVESSNLSSLQHRPFPQETATKGDQPAAPTPISADWQAQQETVARARFNPDRISLYPIDPVKEERREKPIQKKAEPTSEPAPSDSESEEKDKPIQKKAAATPEPESEPKRDEPDQSIQKKAEEPTAKEGAEPAKDTDETEKPVQTKAEEPAAEKAPEKPSDDTDKTVQKKADDASPEQMVKPESESDETNKAVQKKAEEPTAEPESDDQEKSVQKKAESTSEPEPEEKDKPIQKKAEPTAETDEDKAEPIQRKAESESAEEPEKQDDPVAHKAVQTKLTVGKAGDRYEQEADQVAAKVMTMPDPAQNRIQRQPHAAPADLQPKPLASAITPLVQQKSAEEIPAKPAQKKTSPADSHFEARLSSSMAGGSPLPEDVRSFMEPRLGASLKHVKVHMGAEVAQLTKEIGAQAFTYRNHIFYGSGKYPAKDELTAHELTHVIQQTGAVQAKANSENPEDKDTSTHTPQIQRRCSKCEEEQKTHGKEIEGKVQAKELPERAVTGAHSSNFSSEKLETGGTIGQRNNTHNHNWLTGHGIDSPHAGQSAESREFGHQQFPEIVSDTIRTSTEHNKFPSSQNTSSQKNGRQATDTQNEQRKTLKAALKPDLKQIRLPKEVKNQQKKAKPRKKSPSEAPDRAKPSIRKSSKSKTTQSLTTGMLGRAAVQNKSQPHNVRTGLVNRQEGTRRAESQPVIFALPLQQGDPKKRSHYHKQNPQQIREQKRQQLAANQFATQFVSRSAAKLETVHSLGRRIAPRIQDATATAKALIRTATKLQRHALTAHIQRLRQQAQRKAATAKARVNGQCTAVIAAIRASTADARAKVTKSYAKTLGDIKTQQFSQSLKIHQHYVTNNHETISIGVNAGNKAVQVGNRRRDEFLAQRTFKDDNVWDGRYTDNRLEAKADAAVQVAQGNEQGPGYKQGLFNSAFDHAIETQKQKKDDLKVVAEAAQNSRQALDTQHQAVLDGLNHSQEQAIASANQTRNRLIATINQQLNATLQLLKQQETVQLRYLNEFEQTQQQNIERQGQNTIASVRTAVTHTANQLEASLHAFRVQARHTPAPQLALLRAALKQSQAQMDKAVKGIQGRVDVEGNAAAQTIVEGSQQGVTGLQQFGQGARQETSMIEAGFAQTSTQIANTAQTQFSQLQQNHFKSTSNSTKAAVDSFKQVTTSLGEFYTTLDQQVANNLSSNRETLRTSLHDTVHGPADKEGLAKDIEKYAEEAAAQVQPRWKTVLKIVLVIAVVIASIAITVFTLGSGAPLAAVLLVGTIVGALSSAIIQVGNNLIDGKEWHEGVGQAMVIGAIGGLLGAGLGAAGGAIASRAATGVASTVGQTLVRGGIVVGMDAVANATSSVAGSLISGQPITLQGILTEVAIGAIFSIGGEALGGIQARRGAARTPGTPTGDRSPTIRVDETTGSQTPRPSIETDAPAGGASPRDRTSEEAIGSRTEEARVDDQAEHHPRDEVSPSNDTSRPGNEQRATTEETTSSDEVTKPSTGRPETSNPSNRSTDGATDAPPDRSTHENEPEIEPGIVAKKVSADGHEVKVLTDGRIVRCSHPCGPIREEYQPELAQRPDLGAELDRIERLPNSQDKSEQADQVKRELDQIRTIQQDAQRFENFRRQVTPSELRGAPPGPNSNTPGHARSKHNVPNTRVATILNQPERIFSGINYNGREVDIYYQNGDVAITVAGDKTQVITSYGQSGRSGTPVDPERWSNPQNTSGKTDPTDYIEISGDNLNVVVHHRTGRWDRLDSWPPRPDGNSQAPPSDNPPSPSSEPPHYETSSGVDEPTASQQQQPIGGQAGTRDNPVNQGRQPHNDSQTEVQQADTQHNQQVTNQPSSFINPQRRIPPGGMSISDRIAQGGNPPQYARDNPEQYYYDPVSEKYPRRPLLGQRAIPCFPAGTPVATSAGLIPIELLTVGATVKAFDELEETILDNTVTALLHNSTVRLIDISTDEETISSTTRHRFWVENKGQWIEARYLEEGMFLRTISGLVREIKAVIVREVSEQATYNLTVANCHTYFVGGEGFLVHNEDEVPRGKIYIGRDSQKDIIYVGQTKQDLQARQAQHHRDAATRPDTYGYKRDMTIEVFEDLDGLTDDEMNYHERVVFDELRRQGHDIHYGVEPMTWDRLKPIINKYCR